MRLPTWLNTDYVTGYLPLSKFLRKAEDFTGIGLGLGAIPHAKPPLRRVHASAREQVIATHGVKHRRAAKEIDIDAFRVVHLNRHIFADIVLQHRSITG